MNRRTQVFCEKMYGWLLKAYPRAHRDEYGEAMAQAFRDLCRDSYARNGNWGLFNAILFTLLDAVPSIAAEYTAREIHAMFKRILYTNISSNRSDRSLGPVFAIMGAAILALAVYKLRDMHVDRSHFWLGTLAALSLSLQCALLGLLVHVMKVMNLPTLKIRRVPGQMLKYLPGLLFSAGCLGLVGTTLLLAELHLNEAQLLIGVLISLNLAMLCVAMGLLFNLAAPASETAHCS